MIDAIRRDDLEVFTDATALPTGFPFKIARLPRTLSEPAVYDKRDRICDLGMLRELYVKADGSVGFRCSAEPLASYLAKGGSAARTQGSSCFAIRSLP